LSALFNRLRFAKARQVQSFDDLVADPSVEVIVVDSVVEAAA
jgi:hypothetical protein